MSLQKEEKETFSEEICDNYLLSMILFIYIFFFITIIALNVKI